MHCLKMSTNLFNSIILSNTSYESISVIATSRDLTEVLRESVRISNIKTVLLSSIFWTPQIQAFGSASGHSGHLSILKLEGRLPEMPMLLLVAPTVCHAHGLGCSWKPPVQRSRENAKQESTPITFLSHLEFCSSSLAPASCRESRVSRLPKLGNALLCRGLEDDNNSMQVSEFAQR